MLRHAVPQHIPICDYGLPYSVTAVRLSRTYIGRKKIRSWEDRAKKFSWIKGKIDGKSHSEIKRQWRRDPEIPARDNRE